MLYNHTNTGNYRNLEPDENSYYHPNRVLYMRIFMITLFAIFLVFKWTRFSTFFADVRLYPFTVSKKFVHPHKIALIMASSAVISLYCAPCTHSQFVIWSDYLSPVLFMAGSKLLTRERIILHTLIQAHWAEMDLGRSELLIRPTFAVLGFLGFLGYTGLILALLFCVDYLEWDSITTIEEV